MTNDDKRPRDGPDAPDLPDVPVDERWSFPLPREAPESDEADDAEAAPVLLCTVPAAEAEALCARLESEGIPCFLGHEVEGGPSPAPGGGQVAVLVGAFELTAARELLAGAPPGDASNAGDADELAFEQELEERDVEDWICPLCRERTLELLPVPTGWRRVRKASVAVIGLLLLGMALVCVMPFPRREGDSHCLGEVWPVALVLALAVLICSVVFAPQEKRCTKCGWRTKRRGR